jgi:hypothetical protein
MVITRAAARQRRWVLDPPGSSTRSTEAPPGFQCRRRASRAMSPMTHRRGKSRTRARLRRIRLHGLRSTSVSLMLDQGHPPHIVAAWRRPTSYARWVRRYSGDPVAQRRPTGPGTPDPVGTLLGHGALGEGRHRLQSPRNMTLTLREHRWARTVSNRRPLVCKSRPRCPPRFTQCDGVRKCPAQRGFGFRWVH